jgi:hypothetical protein
VNKTVILLIIIGHHVSLISAQNLTQIVKGTVTDKETQVTLPGANVIIRDTDPLLGAITDADGHFKIKNIPVGRHDI